MTSIDDIYDFSSEADPMIFDAISALDGVYVHHRAVKRLLDRLELVKTCGTLGGSAKCFFVLGPSGAGKSQTLKRFASKYPRVNYGIRDEIPVLYMQMPAKATPKSVCEQILLSIGCPHSNYGSLAERELRAIQQLHVAKTQMLIFDEFHHLLDRRTHRVAHDAADFVKGLLNANVSSIVIAGLTDAEIVIEQEEQLRRRSMGRIDLRRFDWSNSEDQIEFRAILVQFEKALPFPGKSGLTDPKVAECIYIASEGLVGIVAQLLIVASIKAAQQSLDRITNECLAAAFDEVRISDIKRKRNPFDQESRPRIKVVTNRA